MKRGDHQVPGERGAHRDVRGFLVANFAEHEHLRILPEQMPRGLGEGESARLVHLGLHDAGDDLLDGIFDRDDVPSAQRGEIGEAGVNGRGLAAARRAGEQQQPGAAAKKSFQLRDGGWRQDQFRERARGGTLKESQHDLLAGHGGIRGHAQIVLRAEIGFVDASVLGERVLIGLEAREKFNPPEQPLRHLLGDGGGRGHHAVQPEGHLRGGAEHLEMNVAGPGAFGLAHNFFEQLGRGCFIRDAPASVAWLWHLRSTMSVHRQ